MNDDNKPLLIETLHQLDRLREIDDALKTHLMANIEMYETTEGDMIRILAMINESIISELKISTMIGALK